ncbi:GNAT family N-acetyltransferase [Halopiger goleimassiliensis]|uniref:GNAT family N-acetyltransferase n=1 Tax=Halopiger goleimassiliensis TaxID=1293048 RepID=UPI000677E314|nr:GNAT family protein [Halopiger goleimassiliensis]
MPGAAFLTGEAITLRVPEPEDREFLARNENDPRVRATRTAASPSGTEDVERYIGGTLGQSDDTIALLVCKDGEPVGLVLLIREKPGDRRYRRGELAFWIAPDEQGNGYATDASRLVLEYAFETLGLHKVVAKAFAANHASQGVLESLGFEQEGTFRNEVYVDGEWQDWYRYGLLRSERDAA